MEQAPGMGRPHDESLACDAWMTNDLEHWNQSRMMSCNYILQ